MNEINPRASRRLSSAAAIVIVGILAVASRADSQIRILSPTETSTPTETPTQPDSGTATPTPTTSPSDTGVPDESPTAAPTDTPVVIPTVEPTPFMGGNAGATEVTEDFGTGGEVVNGGKFEVRNTTDETERITRVEIQATDPEVVSSLSLNGKSSTESLTATVSSPTTNNVFLFDLGLEIPPGEAATFSLAAVIAAQDQTTTEATATPGDTEPTSTPAPTATQTPDPFALSRADTVRVVAAAAIPLRPGAESRNRLGDFAAICVLLAMAAASRVDRRGLSAAFALLVIAALLWMNALPGCGAEQPTSQTVGRITGETDSGPVVFSGVPFSLGTVSRPRHLVFPGAEAGSTSTPIL